MATVPAPLARVIQELTKLPGIGEKTATRLAFHLSRTERRDVEALAAALAALRDDLRICSLCCALAGSDPCDLCGDPRRSADVVCVVDPAALRQILLNLLDNAVKYGPLGQTVTITLRRVGDRVRIMVDDEGPGIPSDERDRVWEPYRRLESAVTAAVAGSGIGLSVVAQLVAMHGGRAWVDSAPGKGARFVVELPSGIGNRESGIGTATAVASEPPPSPVSTG